MFLCVNVLVSISGVLVKKLKLILLSNLDTTANNIVKKVVMPSLKNSLLPFYMSKEFCCNCNFNQITLYLV